MCVLGNYTGTTYLDLNILIIGLKLRYFHIKILGPFIFEKKDADFILARHFAYQPSHLAIINYVTVASRLN